MKNTKETRDGAKPSNAKAMDIEDIESLISKLESEMQTFIEEEEVSVNLTAKERRQLISSSVRNNGFIDKTFDIAHDNPSFIPPNLTAEGLLANEHRFEQLRQLMYVLQQFLQLATNAFMLQSDVCYRQALLIYGSLREQMKARTPGAEELFHALMTFFRKRRRAAAGALTEHELEMDFDKLVHDKADGEIVIKNVAPHTVGGKREVIDTVHSSNDEAKESIKEET